MGCGVVHPFFLYEPAINATFSLLTNMSSVVRELQLMGRLLLLNMKCLRTWSDAINNLIVGDFFSSVIVCYTWPLNVFWFQAKHFGSFLRHQIILPPPSADIQSRMVLTSIDAAIFRTSSDPMGPVHINISFREPLAGIPHAWNTDCLKGLGRWTSNTLPFTKYVKMMKSNSTKQGSISCGDIKEIAETLSSTSRGILVIGGLHKLEESWNAILLAKHLGWPVVPDILSGVRLRHLNSYDVDELCIIDYFDHMLLSTQLQHLIKPDVVLQVCGEYKNVILTTENATHQCTPLLCTSMPNIFYM